MTESHECKMAGCPTEDKIAELREMLEKAQVGLLSAKAFHRNICELAGWFHDEKDWLRDLACVEESLRAKLAAQEKVIGALRKAAEYVYGFRARLSPKDIPTAAFDALEEALAALPTPDEAGNRS